MIEKLASNETDSGIANQECIQPHPSALQSDITTSLDGIQTMFINLRQLLALTVGTLAAAGLTFAHAWNFTRVPPLGVTELGQTELEQTGHFDAWHNSESARQSAVQTMRVAFNKTTFPENTSTPNNPMEPKRMSVTSVERQPYQTTDQGQAVELFTIKNKNGLIASVMTYGATLVSLQAPDKDGKLDNLVLTCPDMNAWQACGSYFGSTVGRFGNRIAKGKFSIDGVDYQLATNNGPNHLHGGDQAFDKKIWNAEILPESEGNGVRFRYSSQDQEEGYPGTLNVTADYLLTDQNELVMRYQATTDKTTPVNLTNHAYWNLGGDKSGTILNQELKLQAQRVLDVDAGLIPTGVLNKVAGTALDFTTSIPLGTNIADVKNTPANGFDHCFAIDGNHGQLRLAATAYDPESGRVLEIFTTQPGIQLYTANHLDKGPGSGGYDSNHAFCLETQNYPDSPNQPDFPSPFLKPAQVYNQETVHKFSVK